jgi:hypothetical protein
MVGWHVTYGVSNGPTQAADLLAKKTLCIGHGFWNFANTANRKRFYLG